MILDDKILTFLRLMYR